jgi:hypothetical protein
MHILGEDQMVEAQVEKRRTLWEIFFSTCTSAKIRFGAGMASFGEATII